MPSAGLGLLNLWGLGAVLVVAVGTALYYMIKEDNEEHNCHNSHSQRNISSSPSYAERNTFQQINRSACTSSSSISTTSSSSRSTTSSSSRSTTAGSSRTIIEPSCNICYDTMNYSRYVTLLCNHRFHSACIDTWFTKQRTCPLCRSEVN